MKTKITRVFPPESELDLMAMRALEGTEFVMRTETRPHPQNAQQQIPVIVFESKEEIDISKFVKPDKPVDRLDD